MEILVDTSVWVDFFNGVNSPGAGCLKKMLEAEDPVCISDVIIAETLQGFKHGSHKGAGSKPQGAGFISGSRSLDLICHKGIKLI